MKAIIYWLFLRPLIALDYQLRGIGLRPDRMYWADSLALSWGYFGTEGRG